MRGWWKAPSRFLPCRVLIPVLPPTELSTCDSSVVGTCTNGRPRSVVAAAKPARSPTTPPPSAITAVRRSIPRVEQLIHHLAVTWIRVFDVSPGGTVMLRVSIPVSASPRSSAGRCSGATVASVTTTARFCGSTGASSAPARASRSSPTTTS